jgi:hypothetical protein
MPELGCDNFFPGSENR